MCVQLKQITRQVHSEFLNYYQEADNSTTVEKYSSRFFVTQFEKHWFTEITIIDSFMQVGETW